MCIKTLKLSEAKVENSYPFLIVKAGSSNPLADFDTFEIQKRKVKKNKNNH